MAWFSAGRDQTAESGGCGLDIALELVEKFVASDLSKINSLGTAARDKGHVGDADDPQHQAQIPGVAMSRSRIGEPSV